MTSYSGANLGYIGSGNGLLPDGTEALPEPVLTNYQWDLVSLTQGQYHMKLLKITGGLWNCLRLFVRSFHTLQTPLCSSHCTHWLSNRITGIVLAHGCATPYSVAHRAHQWLPIGHLICLPHCKKRNSQGNPWADSLKIKFYYHRISIHLACLQQCSNGHYSGSKCCCAHLSVTGQCYSSEVLDYYSIIT